VIEARARGCAIAAKKSRAQLAREARNRGLVERLLATDMHDVEGVRALLAAARQDCPKQDTEQHQPASLASGQSDTS
jgi:hypothetical protein